MNLAIGLVVFPVRGASPREWQRAENATSEEDLLTLAAQDGDEEAFGMIYQRYHSLLVKYAYKVIGDAGLAQNAVQEAWMSESSASNCRWPGSNRSRGKPLW